MHQEPINLFFPFIENTLGKEFLDKFKKFHYGDDTIDDSGDTRYSARECKIRYESDISDLNIELDKWTNTVIFLDRFLFVGNVGDVATDVVYHGTIAKGLWATREEIIQYIKSKNFDLNAVHFRPLTYQVWGRNEKYTAVHPNRRYVMQVKWSSIGKDLKTIRAKDANNYKGTQEGDIDEIIFVKKFNSNKNDFKTYLSKFEQFSNRWMVRVTTKQISSLTKKKVFTRSDCYLASINDDINSILNENNYYLSEDILNKNNIKYEKIPYSGISIKMTNSKNFQILKITPISFNSLFGTFELGAGASLYCLNENELNKNLDLIKGWKSSPIIMSKYFCNFTRNNEKFYLNQDICKNIKHFSSNEIKRLINNSIKLQEKIFNGIGLYKEPYTAFYFYHGDDLSKLSTIPFNVTTGSGRSKGIYTIVLKP